MKLLLTILAVAVALNCGSHAATTGLQAGARELLQSSGSCPDVNNCQSCTDVDQTCHMCLLGYRLSADRKTCSPCGTGCCWCNEADECTQCCGGYALLNDTYTCRACPSNCLMCSWNADLQKTWCDQCSLYYTGKTNGDCVSCGSNCAACTAINDKPSCSSCWDRYTKDSSGNCISCGLGCKSCSYDSSNNKVLCNTCDDNWALKETDKTCKSCSSFHPACVRCVEENLVFKCTECGTGWYLKSDTCLPCPRNCAECEEVNGQPKCTTCMPYYELLADDHSCDDCPLHCWECEVVGTVAFCKSGRCESRYARNSQDGKCYACPSNCKVCSYTGGKTMCSTGQCDDGYALKDDGTCGKCPSNCHSCYFDSFDSTVRCFASQCERGYGFEDVTGSCLSCGVGCVRCQIEDGLPKCKECELRYGMTSDHACSPCPAQCECCEEVSAGTMRCVGGQCSDDNAFRYGSLDCLNNCNPAGTTCSDQRYDRWGTCTCRTCPADYLLVGAGPTQGSCKGCSQTISNCVLCQLDSDLINLVCIKCACGYNLVDGKCLNDCGPVAPYCSAFQVTPNNNCGCKTCHAGYGRLVVDTARHPPYASYTCIACASIMDKRTPVAAVSHCLECGEVNSVMKCSKCGWNDDYVVRISAPSVPTCEPRISNCLEEVPSSNTNDDPRVCGRCKRGFGVPSGNPAVSADMCTTCGPNCDMCWTSTTTPHVFCNFCNNGNGGETCNDDCASPFASPAPFPSADNPSCLNFGFSTYDAPGPSAVCMCTQCAGASVAQSPDTLGDIRLDRAHMAPTCATGPAVDNCAAPVLLTGAPASVSACNLCNPSYELNSARKCVACGTSATAIANCVTHYVDKTNNCKCAECAANYYLDDDRSSCAQCSIANCAAGQYFRAGGECYCSSCNSPTTESIDYKECKDCSAGSPGCAAGQTYVFGGECKCSGIGGCTGNYQFAVKKQLCIDCDSMVTNDHCAASGLSLDDDGGCCCLSCDGNDILRDDGLGCHDCSSFSAACTFSDSSGTCACTGCTGNNALVDGNCQSCTSPAIPNCNTYVRGDGTSCVCSDCAGGLPTPDGSCATCAISHCNAYELDGSACTLCTSCDDGYELTSARTMCQSCTGNGFAKCKKCKLSSGSPQLVSECTECISGAVLYNSNCVGCDPKCNKCRMMPGSSSQTHCLQWECDTNYGLHDDDFNCGACNTAWCLTCFIDTTNHEWCEVCDDGYVLSWDQETCLSCPNKCDKCYETEQGGTTMCWDSGCEDGYMTDLDNDNNCIPCDDGCRLCRLAGVVKECYWCKEEYVLNGVECLRCTANCLTCSVENECNLNGCKSGYFYDSPSKRCHSCQSPCATCQYTNSQVVCKTCVSGYTLFSGICYKCDEGCSSCTTNDGISFSCSTCGGGYTFDGTGCVPCPGNCLSCDWDANNNVAFCNDGFCASGYGRKLDRLCYPCPIQWCVTCPVNSLTDVLVCDSCQSHYYLNDDDCAACPRWCPKCSWSNGRMSCSQCDPYYAITSDGDCQACPSNCAECFESGGETFCTKCRGDGTFSLTIDGKCVACREAAFDNCFNCTKSDALGRADCLECDGGYNLLDDKSSCQPCSIASCGRCTHGRLCTSCATGFHIFDEDHQCGVECLTCKGSEEVCGGDLSSVTNATADVGFKLCSGGCVAQRVENTVTNVVEYQRYCRNVTCAANEAQEICEEDLNAQTKTCWRCCLEGVGCNSFVVDGIADSATFLTAGLLCLLVALLTAIF